MLHNWYSHTQFSFLRHSFFPFNNTMHTTHTHSFTCPCLAYAAYVLISLFHSFQVMSISILSLLLTNSHFPITHNFIQSPQFMLLRSEHFLFDFLSNSCHPILTMRLIIFMLTLHHQSHCFLRILMPIIFSSLIFVHHKQCCGHSYNALYSLMPSTS